MRLRVIAVFAAVLLAGCTGQPTTAPMPTPIAAVASAGSVLWDPVDPSLPDITEPSGDARKVKGGWKVASADYFYRWNASSNWEIDYQQLVNEGDGYLRDGEVRVNNDMVDAVVASLDRLYPVQQRQIGRGWSNDSPIWDIELVGTDGQRVLLTSASTGNPGSGPWSVLINGRLYAQYDGAIGWALGNIFAGRLAQPSALDQPRSEKPAEIDLYDWVLPSQLTMGFSGLLPLSPFDELKYVANRESGRIEGMVRNALQYVPTTAGRVEKKADALTRIDSVTISTADKGSVQCELNEVKAPSKEEMTQWRFTCPVTIGDEGSRYRIPIDMEATTLGGQALHLSGELWGMWDTRGTMPLLPPPAEITSAISSSPDLADLLNDHTIITSSYTAQFMSDRPLVGKRQGTMTLLGEKTVNGRKVAHAVSAYFLLQDGRFTKWSFNRAELDKLLDDIVRLPITARALDADPNLVIHIGYPGSREVYTEFGPREREALIAGLDSRERWVNIPQCPGVLSGTRPSGEEQAAGFSFGLPGRFASPQFLLVGGQAVAYYFSANTEPDRFCSWCPPGSLKAWEAIMPDVLRMGPARPFSSVAYDALRRSHIPFPLLTLTVPPDATVEELQAYEQKVRSLPGQASHPFGGNPTAEMTDTWIVSEVGIAVTDDGKLEIRSCRN